MKRTIIILLVLLLSGSLCNSYGQLYFTKNGRLSFFSKTPIENISADNNQVLSVLNVQTGVLQFSVLNNAFYFPKAKMQEDFNENYMETYKYPMSTFRGNITDISNVDISKDGSYNVSVKGDLSIHGVTKSITVPATITVTGGKISAASSFKVLVKDYNISVPTIVTNKIAETIEVTVSCNYEKK